MLLHVLQTQTWQLPDLAPSKAAIARFSMPPRCCCWSKDGQHIAAAGDDGIVKLMAAKDGKVHQ